MEIKCNATKRFLLNVDTEQFYSTISSLLKTHIEIPITIEIPCRSCKMIEVYEVYKNHYIHKKSYKKIK